MNTLGKQGQALIPILEQGRAGVEQFARGMDLGPVKGAPGTAVPIIAHAGEWVVTPEQMSRLASGSYQAPVAAPAPAPLGIDYGRLGAAVATALADNPSRSYVVASDVAESPHKSRRR